MNSDLSSSKESVSENTDSSYRQLPRRKQRWGLNFLVACSFVIGLSLWLHYSVNGHADSFQAIALRSLTAVRTAQLSFEAKEHHFAIQPEELRSSLKSIHTGPYFLLLNPGCKPPATVLDSSINENAITKLPHEHEDLLLKSLARYNLCPTDPKTYYAFAAAYSKKAAAWDVWLLNPQGQMAHLATAPLPPTHSHQVKRIAIVLLVLGAIGLASILLPRLFDRFFAKQND